MRNAGVQVQTRPRLGPWEITNRALADGSITVMPEYTGNLLHFLDPASTAATADDVYAALRKALPPTLQLLQQSTAEELRRAGRHPADVGKPRTGQHGGAGTALPAADLGCRR
ncbi:MAG TPA: hypothetical protein VF003_06010 [Pseudonocardiaceae bacterium]